MISTTIKLQGFASYSPVAPITVTLTKSVAVFYGHNGSGKSTIAKAIRCLSNPELGSAGRCSVSVDGLASPEFMIFDTTYVEENFHPKNGAGIRGIFTLGKRTAEELEEIQRIEEELSVITQAGQQATSRLTELENERDRASTNIKSSTWEIKVAYEKGPLRFCLEENKVRSDKAKLFNHLTKESETDASVSIEDLLRGAREIEDEAVDKKQAITAPSDVFSSVENNHLLGSVIAGSSDSRLSALISTLKNESWVKSGLDHLNGSHGACPFCQQLVPNDLPAELSKLFDTAYQEQCSEIAALRASYSAAVESLSELLKEAPYQDDYVIADLAFQNACKDLQLVVESNLTLLDRKVNNPRDPVALKSSDSALQVCQDLAGKLNAKIEDYNSRITNRERVKKDIDRQFWKLMRRDYAHALSAYQKAVAAIDAEQQQVREKVGRLRGEYAEKSARLRDLRASSTSIDASVDVINQRIENIGIRGFRIEKDDANPGYYHIARGDQGNIDYRSLSEGEKSLITFLYFVESLNGSHSSDGIANKESKIVVIDDPISSLSHNHVYDIASLITLKLIEPKEFHQVVILTHSLFFYHELFKAAKPKSRRDYQCFRVTKGDYSTAYEIAQDEIKNEYQSYWLVLKEGLANGTYSVALPIAMRYILEHYFTFVGTQDELAPALLSLGDSDKPFHAFYRYINRQSHADSTNISDLPSIAPSTYIEKFRQVFQHTNQLQHFNRMMGVEGLEGA